MEGNASARQEISSDTTRGTDPNADLEILTALKKNSVINEGNRNYRVALKGTPTCPVTSITRAIA